MPKRKIRFSSSPRKKSPRKSNNVVAADENGGIGVENEDNPFARVIVTFEDGVEIQIKPTDELKCCLLEKERKDENEMPCSRALECDVNPRTLQIPSSTTSKRASPLSPTLLDNVRQPSQVQPAPTQPLEPVAPPPASPDSPKTDDDEDVVVSTGRRRRTLKRRRILSESEETPSTKSKRVQEDASITTPSISTQQTTSQSETKETSSDKEGRVELPEAVFRIIDDYHLPDAPPMDKDNYIKCTPKTKEELCREVQYELDEVDMCWLEGINKRRANCNGLNLGNVELDEMELLIDRLEKEHYFEWKNLGMGQPGESDEDAVCCVCLDGESDNSNQIIFCDMCNIPVHQDCYGVPFIPEGSWLCRRCSISPNADISCIFCPNKDGAFKPTIDGRWSHVLCALWIPEVRFANPSLVEPVDDIGDIPPGRWKLVCFLCKKKNVGACIQCTRLRACVTAFHVTCAQAAGLSLLVTSKDFNGDAGVQMQSACDKHTSEKRRQIMLQKVETMNKVLYEKRAAPAESKFPQISDERINAISELVSFPGKTVFMARLIAYWKIKRSSRGGAPLIRNVDTFWVENEMYPPTPDPLVRPIDKTLMQECYMNMLRSKRELTKILEYCTIIKTYKETGKEALELDFQICDSQIKALEVHVIEPMYSQVLEKLIAKDKKEIFTEPVSAEEAPDYFTVITNPMDLSTMKNNLMKYSSLNDLEADFRLMISNCMTYNKRSTVFHKAAVQLSAYGDEIFQEARRSLDQRQELERKEKERSSPVKTEKDSKQRELKNLLRNIVKRLARHDEHEIFIEPVDTNAVPDYLTIIKNPMCFTTMRNKIDEDQYNCIQDLQADYCLMINNCMEYNEEDSEYYEIATKMKKLGQNIFEKVKKDYRAKNTTLPLPPRESASTSSSKNKSENDDNNNGDSGETKKVCLVKPTVCVSTSESENSGNALLAQVLTNLIAKDEDEVFSEPVNVEELPDYLSIVTTPIDLSEMQNKLNSSQYVNLDELEKDFYLMIDNCMLYNGKRSWYYSYANRFKKLGDIIFRDARKETDGNK